MDSHRPDEFSFLNENFQYRWSFETKIIINSRYHLIKPKWFFHFLRDHFSSFSTKDFNERNTFLLFQVGPSGYDTWILFGHFWFILWDIDSLNSLFPLTTFSLKIDFNKVTLPRPWGSQLLLRREKMTRNWVKIP